MSLTAIAAAVVLSPLDDLIIQGASLVPDQKQVRHNVFCLHSRGNGLSTTFGGI